MKHNEKLWKAADTGNLDDLNKLLAEGADPNGFKDSVRVIAEGGRAPPHPRLCGLVFRRVSVTSAHAAAGCRGMR